MKTLVVEMHDPRHPKLQSESQDIASPFLAPFLKYCEYSIVTAVKDLKAAPAEVQALLKAHQLRAIIMNYIYSGRAVELQTKDE